MRGHLALALVDPGNPFQQLLKADAETAARRAGVALETTFTTDSFTEQLAALRRLIADADKRPAAILVMAVRDQGLVRVVREAAVAGVHWVFLNAIEDDLGPVRGEFPGVSISVVCPDEVETGRVQGRQVRALVSSGRRVLYVQGSARSLASRQRTRGFQEAVAGSGIDVALAGGDWAVEHAARTVTEWLRFAVGGRRPFDLVCCQNDQMAAAACDVLKKAGAEAGREYVGRIPVTGCDGAPDDGVKQVNEGRLVATVVLPRWTGPAVELLSRLLARGERPALEVLLTPTSFPPLEALKPIG